MDETISKYNPAATLAYITRYPENQYLERKGIEESGIKPAKLANELIGMLNADGGMLVLGVSDDGEIQDLNTLTEQQLRDYRQILHDLIKPPANACLEEVTLPDGKLIFLYHVEQDYERLFSQKNSDSVYRRVADSNKGPLDNDQIDKLRYDKSIRSFEDQKREDFDPRDLETATIEFYKKKIKFVGSNEDLLVKRNLAIRKDDRVIYKNSAILLFAEDPEKYIPSASIRYVRYEGDKPLPGESFNVIKDERFYGNIPTLISSVQKFIYASLNDYFYLDVRTGRFVSVSEYPEGAWLEGVVNALFHRSYNLQGNAVYIRHYDDRLEISNSGPLPAQVTVENIRSERFSRNPRIGRVLSEMGFTRELNEGVNRIYSSMEKSMLSQPEYTDTNDIVTLVLRNKLSKHEKSIPDFVFATIERGWMKYNDTEQKIIGYLFNNYHATIEELAAYANVSPQAIRTYLNRFTDGADAIIERHSEKIRDKNAIYSFKKKSS